MGNLARYTRFSHFINYSADGHPGRWPWHGAYSFELHPVGPLKYVNRRELRFEWSWGWRGLAAEMTLCPDADRPVQITLHAAWWSGYLGLASPFLVRWASRTPRRREYGFSAFFEDSTIRVSCGQDPMAWSRNDPWWWRWHINLADAFFGRTTCVVTKGEPYALEIPLPEGVYTVTAQPETYEWRRPRWPWWPLTLRRQSTDIKSDDGLPVPGKGENSWDCGDDAIHGMGADGIDRASVIAAVVKSVMGTRQRYASITWRPSPRQPLAS